MSIRINQIRNFQRISALAVDNPAKALFHEFAGEQLAFKENQSYLCKSGVASYPMMPR
jgi:hypothetical protein